MTLVSYVNHVRLANPAPFLRDTGHPIVEIPETTGFSDLSRLDRRFKRACGRTPKEFRADRPG